MDSFIIQNMIIQICRERRASFPLAPVYQTHSHLQTHKYIYIHTGTTFLVPRIKIVDERHQEVEDRIFYDKGSTIKLKCMVENIVGEQPEYIIWKKGDRMLNYDTERGGIRWGKNLQTDHLRLRPQNLYCRRVQSKMTLVFGGKNKLMFLMFRLKSCKINFKLKYVPRLLVWLALYIIQTYVTT